MGKKNKIKLFTDYLFIENLKESMRKLLQLLKI